MLQNTFFAFHINSVFACIYGWLILYYKTEPSVNEEHLIEIAGKIGDRWKRIAKDLGFKTSEVADLEGKSPRNEDRCYCMLQSWKDRLAPHYNGQKDLWNVAVIEIW